MMGVPTKSLSPREHQVLRLLAEGLHTREVAEHLNLSWRTVQSQAAHARRKLGARNAAHAVAIAVKAGLI